MQIQALVGSNQHHSQLTELERQQAHVDEQLASEKRNIERALKEGEPPQMVRNIGILLFITET